MIDDDREEYERTLLQLPNCHAFRIPARKSAEGHRAADWPKDPIFTGKLKITAKGKVAVITLIDSDNKVFASCPVQDDSCVERCLDSGRYFVLKIQNAQGKFGYCGIAFNERNDAFDFNVALAEHKGENERELKAVDNAETQPSRDFSLKEGEKIKVQVKIGSGVSKEKPKSSGGGFLLAPPPSDAKSKSSLLAPPPADNNNNKSSGIIKNDFFSNSKSSDSTSTNLLDF